MVTVHGPGTDAFSWRKTLTWLSSSVLINGLPIKWVCPPALPARRIPETLKLNENRRESTVAKTVCRPDCCRVDARVVGFRIRGRGRGPLARETWRHDERGGDCTLCTVADVYRVISAIEPALVGA